MDRLDELTIFVSIIEAGSLINASRRLRRSPPAVTRALTALEDRVGLRLVERTTRRLAPTEAGTALAERARTLVRLRLMLAGMSHAPVRGVLRITAPVQFGRRHVAPIVSAFLNNIRRCGSSSSLNDRNLDLIEEGLDLAVRIGPLADSSLVARQIGSVRRVVVASPGYLERRGIPRTPQDLTSHDTIFGMARSSASEWRFGPSPRGPVVRLTPRLLVDDVEAQLQAAQAGRGIARPLSYQVADELADGSLIRILQDFEPEPLPVYLVTSSRTHMSPKVRAFWDSAIGIFRDVDFIRYRSQGCKRVTDQGEPGAPGRSAKERVQRARSWMRNSPSTHSSTASAHRRYPPQWGGRGTSTATCVGFSSARTLVGNPEAACRRRDASHERLARCHRLALLAGPGAEAALPGAGCGNKRRSRHPRGFDRAFGAHLAMAMIPVKNHRGPALASSSRPLRDR